MIIIFGLVVLLAAVIIAVAGVLGNAGSAHMLTDNFSVFGYHVTGSTGTLFLYGIIVGAVAAAGLGVLLAGARRTSRRGRLARRELKRTRETIAGPTISARSRQLPTALTHGGTHSEAIRPPARPPPHAEQDTRFCEHGRLLHASRRPRQTRTMTLSADGDQ
ncbi:hypothetical protein [Nocardia speluncae]|uniref:hypothetical protein n=1 Tax=Nocardia speluncae TaxID=419477 RepID=UPI000AB22721|nr:hypothetical protein [Nocardia speluncae]